MERLQLIDRFGSTLNRSDVMSGKAALLVGESVHRELRPSMPRDYLGHITTILEEGGCLTHLVDEGEVRALALWRAFHTTYCGRRFEIDDLVTSPAHRSKSYGGTLLTWLEDEARALGCPTLTLNSATHRRDAHRFYFRQRYAVAAFHFSKEVVPTKCTMAKEK